MKKIGTLRLKMGVARVSGVRLAVGSAEHPLKAATQLLLDRGLHTDERVLVVGKMGKIGNTPAFLVAEATALPAAATASATALSSFLGGDVGDVPDEIECGRCKYVNKVAFFDPDFPTQCANPKPPTHVLEV